MVQGRTHYLKKTGQYLRNDELDEYSPDELEVKWEKMSKSKHNGVNPNTCIEEHGADVTRVFTLFKVSWLTLLINTVYHVVLLFIISDCVYIYGFYYSRPHQKWIFNGIQMVTGLLNNFCFPILPFYLLAIKGVKLWLIRVWKLVNEHNERSTTNREVNSTDISKLVSVREKAIEQVVYISNITEHIAIVM